MSTIRSGRKGSINLLYVFHNKALSELDQQLLELYTRNVAISFENISLFEDFQETARNLSAYLPMQLKLVAVRQARMSYEWL